MKRDRTFTNTPESAAHARRFVARVLTDVDAGSRSTISVMVSELATNSIRHAATSFTVNVERVPGMVRVEVSDSGEGEPKMRAPAVSDPTGRGLRIVEELADDWGVVPTPYGKMVWFVLMTPSDARVST